MLTARGATSGNPLRQSRCSTRVRKLSAISSRPPIRVSMSRVGEHPTLARPPTSDPSCDPIGYMGSERVGLGQRARKAMHGA